MRVFMLGFNKCGTTSFHDFFKANGYSSIHWRANTLAMRIKENIDRGKWPILEGLDHWTAYSDMICIPGSPWNNSNSDAYPLIEGCRYYKEMHRSYPDSYFVLNTRPIESWIRSRLNHDAGQFANAYLNALKPLGIIDREGMICYWKNEWKLHHREVEDYFGDIRSERFMTFDIIKSDPNKLVEFLGRDLEIRDRTFPHSHRSK